MQDDYAVLRCRVLAKIQQNLGGVYRQSADREDAVQDAMVALLEAKETVQRPLAYALGAARLAGLRTMTRRIRPHYVGDAVERFSSVGVDPADQASLLDDQRAVRSAICSLRRCHRDTLEVVLRHGYSSRHVSSVLRIRRDHARVRMSRAIKELRVRMGEGPNRPRVR